MRASSGFSFLFALALPFASLFGLGCGDSASDGSGGGTTTGDTGGGSTTANTGGGSTSGTTGAGGGNECTNLTYGADVLPTYKTESEPAPAGGTIVDGTYELTVLTHYDEPAAGTGNDPTKSTIKFDGTSIEWAALPADDPEIRGSFTYTAGATTLNLTNVCPMAGPGGTPGYTATPTTFILYLDAEYTFTKL